MSGAYSDLPEETLRDVMLEIAEERERRRPYVPVKRRSPMSDEDMQRYIPEHAGASVTLEGNRFIDGWNEEEWQRLETSEGRVWHAMSIRNRTRGRWCW